MPATETKVPTSPALHAPDLTRRPPRSPRVRLGGYVILARMLDKGRATLAGKNGDYHFNCPLDQHFVRFTEIDPEALKAELAKGKGDGEILAWIEANAKRKPQPWEIQAWSRFHDSRAPGDNESREFFNKSLANAPEREDVAGWFDLLDFDDYVSFGGKA